VFPLYAEKEKSCIVNEHHAGIWGSGVKVTHITNPGSRFMQLTSFMLGCCIIILLYINDLLQITNDNSKIVLFADDTSIIITNPNATNFENNVNKIFQHINEWFSTNLLSSILDKTHYMQFVIKNSPLIDFNIMHGNKKTANICNTKFLGLTLDNTLSWKTHIGTIMPELSSASFAMRAVKPFLSQDSLRMVYYSYFHSIMTYGLIFWGNSHYSSIIFRLQ
jgi:hypothetical protein